ncbi:MAG TPA: tyrosine-type recombinase/integrase [Solirubrobacterales bacterium]
MIEPKSRAGRRSVPLLAILLDYLREHCAGRVCRLPLALVRCRPCALRPAIERERREPKLLVPISLHLCRHTFASLMIDSGANPKAIQEFMGHSKIQTTFDVYGHLLPGSHDEVRMRMDLYLRRGKS